MSWKISSSHLALRVGKLSFNFTDMIKTIKAIHTIIWGVMASAIFYTLYAGITKRFNPLLWLSIGLVMIESAVLIINKWMCPLTPMAMKYTSDRSDNFDIYLPEWIARHNKLIFGLIFMAALLLVIYNLIKRA